MKNRSVSDFVANTMDSILKSAEHKSLFKEQYKFASAEVEEDKVEDENDACDKCDKDENDASFQSFKELKHQQMEEAEKNNRKNLERNNGFPWHMTEEEKHKALIERRELAERNRLKEKVGEYANADNYADDMTVSAAYNIAIDSLLTASAALDSVGLDRGSSLSLKLASLVVEAKKNDGDSSAKAKFLAKKKEKKEKELKLAKEKKMKEAAKEKEMKAAMKAKEEKAKADKKAKEEKAKKSSSSKSK